MIHVAAPTFSAVFRTLCRMMVKAPIVKTERWQGKDVRKDRAAETSELRNVVFEVDLHRFEKLGHDIERLDTWREDIAPNLPWADDHFDERVRGEPLNPGVEWANWPWSTSAQKFQDDARFNHTYMERLWPKYARMTDDGQLSLMDEGKFPRRKPAGPRAHHPAAPRHGVAWEYGDLRDVVDMLIAEPHTRQAWIPLFFPEDTGVADGGRKPCTLGYHFIVRDKRLHLYYPLRSCDLVRHFRDDCYLAVRLMLWVIQGCQDEDKWWSDVQLGTYAMHVTSLHIFANDLIRLKHGEEL